MTNAQRSRQMASATKTADAILSKRLSKFSKVANTYRRLRRLEGRIPTGALFIQSLFCSGPL